MEERQMEVTINYNGQAVAVEVTLEVYEFLDRADHKTENLFHEQRRHWDGREKVSLRGGIVLPSSAKNRKELKQHYLKWRGKNRWMIS